MHADSPDSPDYPRALGCSVLAALGLTCTVSPARAEQFIGQFEPKTLESEPGRFELQSQNAWAQGNPARRSATVPDGVEFDENAMVRQRYALELEMGFTNRVKMRVGVEFEQERFENAETIHQANDFDDPSLADVGVEIVAVLAPREGDGAGFGVVAELEGPPDQEESNNLSLGTIFEFQSGRWFAAVIPTVVYAFGGDAEEGQRVDNKWDFAYALQLAHTFSENWTLALEAYGTVERLGSSGHPSEAARLFGDLDQHRAGPVLYYTYDFGASGSRGSTTSRSELLPGAGAEETGASLTVGLGVLEGLNRNTSDHTLKLSIELHF